MKHIANLIILTILLVLFYSCKNGTNRNIENQEEFEGFYAKFYEDSIFQFSRMKFPLKGGEIGGDDYVPSDIEGSTYEPRKEWKLEDFHAILPGIESYPKENYELILTKTDTLVTEKIVLHSSGYSEIREFRLYDNKWYLDYFFIQNF